MQQAKPSLVSQLDDLLPQTQCTKCGYDGCTPYAQALARGDADVNRCPPGGDAGIQALAQVLRVAALPLDTTRGQHGPLHVARIDEPHCIGCTLCIQACPVDAIIGANKRMHTVLPELCTGCELCVAPCPVDCIVMQPAEPQRYWTRGDARAARHRYEQRRARLRAQPNAALPAYADVADVTPAQKTVRACTNSRKPLTEVTADASASEAALPHTDEQQRRAAIDAALARARARRAAAR